jgi:hypothetical protein
VTASVDCSPLLLRIGTPEQEHDVLTLSIHHIDYPVGKTFPADLLVGERFSLLNGKERIKKEDSGAGPTFE